MLCFFFGYSASLGDICQHLEEATPTPYPCIMRNSKNVYLQTTNLQRGDCTPFPGAAIRCKSGILAQVGLPMYNCWSNHRPPYIQKVPTNKLAHPITGRQTRQGQFPHEPQPRTKSNQAGIIQVSVKADVLAYGHISLVIFVFHEFVFMFGYVWLFTGTNRNSWVLIVPRFAPDYLSIVCLSNRSSWYNPDGTKALYWLREACNEPDETAQTHTCNSSSGAGIVPV